MKSISASDIKSLEDYAVALVTSIISLKSMEMYHIFTYKQGLMNEDEEETSKTILWESKRLIALYTKQLEFITDRTGIDVESITAQVKGQYENE